MPFGYVALNRALRPGRRVLSALAFSVGCLAAQAATIALVPPSSVKANVGDSFSLDLTVTGVADLYGYNFSLKFDPAIIHLASLTEGPALAGAGASFFVPGAFDNVGGVLELTGDVLIGAVTGYTGSGVLATIGFQAVGAGISDVVVNDLMLLDSSLAALSVTDSPARVEVLAPTPAPEPATGLLLIPALAWLAARRRSNVPRPTAAA